MAEKQIRTQRFWFLVWMGINNLTTKSRLGVVMETADQMLPLTGMAPCYM